MMIDPIILFIASNALFVAFCALLATVSNEIFKTELNKNKNITFFYNSKDAFKLRLEIRKFIKFSFVFYFLLYFLVMAYFLVEYIFAPNLSVSNSSIFSRIIILVVLYFIPLFVLRIMFLLNSFFKIRSSIIKSHSNEKL